MEKHIQYIIKKFVNHLMFSGKKGKAEKIFLNSLLLFQVKEKFSPLIAFLRAVHNVKPIIEIRSVRKGGATYQIPVPITEDRSTSLAVKWILNTARKRGGSSMSFNLYLTLLEASKKSGESVKKKEALHSIALKNRSLTHFRWY